MLNINPKNYNLSSRIILQEDISKKLFIVVRRKSRIIMKDGVRLLGISKKIKEKEKNRKTGVLTTAPICSKTKKYLEENGISVQPL
tara:strand:- start:278 stop:535 length:258 start_codon:yes stop_codon:yes gene_type:complete